MSSANPVLPVRIQAQQGRSVKLNPELRSRSSVFAPGFIHTTRALILTWLLAISSLACAEPAADFEAANKLFEQGKVADAAAAYEKLLTNGPTAALHFNLGNARFKNGQPGRAVFHYHQALRFAPRDPDIRGNLQFTRRSLGVTREDPLFRHLLRTQYTVNEWSWMAGVGLGAWFLMLALGEAVPTKRANFAWLTKTFGVTAIASVSLLIAALIERHSSREAVVVVESPVRPGPLAESKVAFSLRDGTEISVLDAKDEWLQVRDASQRTGWVKRDGVWLLP